MNTGTFWTQVIYMDARGDDRVRSFRNPLKLEDFIRRLRRDAYIKNACGEPCRYPRAGRHRAKKRAVGRAKGQGIEQGAPIPEKWRRSLIAAGLTSDQRPARE